MPALAGAAKLLAAAFVAYVVLRLGVVFFGGLGAVVAAFVLAAGAYAAWRRAEWTVLGGLAAGAAVSAAALAAL